MVINKFLTVKFYNATGMAMLTTITYFIHPSYLQACETYKISYKLIHL